MSEAAIVTLRRRARRRGAVRSSVAAGSAFLRRLPLFFSRSPKTPLRVLGIMALDTIHVLDTSRALSTSAAHNVAALLDLLGCANAAWDRKAGSQSEFVELRRQLDAAGFQTLVDAYLGRLQALESARPAVGGDAPQFEHARAYREAVARLSLATGIVIALELPSIDAALAALQNDADFATLSRILLLCQIVDDVFDYRADVAAALPSYLTATSSPSEALSSIATTVRTYGAAVAADSGRPIFPLRVAHFIVTSLARIVVRGAQMRFHRAAGRGFTPGVQRP